MRPSPWSLFAWRAGVPALLVLMAALQWTAALQESQTYDEAVHLSAGYTYLRTGDFHRNPEHPPLAKLLAALPLLALSPALPVEDPAWGGDMRMYGAVFLYRNHVDAGRMLLAGRAVSMAATLALGLLLAVWMRRRFGMAASLLSLALYALDSNVLAHGRYVTNDVLTGLACLAACIAWGSYLERGGPGRLALAALLLGLAFSTKFSTVFLLPVFALLLWLRRARWRSLAAVTAGAFVVVAAVYAPETARVLAHPAAQPRLADVIGHSTAAGEALYRVARLLHLPKHSWLVGLESAARHDRIGHPSYLLGHSSTTGGWWYYFPVAFAVKAPAALLLLTLAASWLGLRRLTRRLDWRQVDFAWYVLLVPLAFYAALTLNTRLNIGIRHLMPVWPFLLAVVSAAAVRLPHARIVIPAVLLLHAGEAVRIYPHHLAFFNVFAGGPARGANYLLDSNLDWGQDLPTLRRWLDGHGRPPVCLAYFGTADTGYYGVPHLGIPYTGNAAARGRLDCVAAVSATLLHDLYLEPGAYRWLRERQPLGNAGWSIVLYDLRQR